MIKGPLGVTHHTWRGGCRVSLSSLVIVTTELEAIDLKKKIKKKGLKEVKLCSKSLNTMLRLCYLHAQNGPKMKCATKDTRQSAQRATCRCGRTAVKAPLVGDLAVSIR